MPKFVSKLEVCPTTGIASYEIEFDIGDGIRSDRGSFMDRKEAERYLYSIRRDFILIVFERYVNHARILLEVGHKAFYRRPEKMASFDRCHQYNHWLQDKDLKVICKTILRIREDLEKILPAESNNSYDSSKSRMLDMIVFCKSQLPASEIPTLASIRKQALA